MVQSVLHHKTLTSVPDNFWPQQYHIQRWADRPSHQEDKHPTPDRNMLHAKGPTTTAVLLASGIRGGVAELLLTLSSRGDWSGVTQVTS